MGSWWAATGGTKKEKKNLVIKYSWWVGSKIFLIMYFNELLLLMGLYMNEFLKFWGPPNLGSLKPLLKWL